MVGGFSDEGLVAEVVDAGGVDDWFVGAGRLGFPAEQRLAGLLYTGGPLPSGNLLQRKRAEILVHPPVAWSPGADPLFPGDPLIGPLAGVADRVVGQVRLWDKALFGEDIAQVQWVFPSFQRRRHRVHPVPHQEPVLRRSRHYFQEWHARGIRAGRSKEPVGGELLDEPAQPTHPERPHASPTDA